MGLTIDEDIKMLEYIKRDFPHCRQGIALEDAIETMRKYQKIEQILKDIPYGGDATVRRIQEVIEDGTD